MKKSFKLKRYAALPLIALLSLTVFTANAANSAKSAVAKKVATKAGKQAKDLDIRKQIVKEAADAFKATQAALKALENDQPKQAQAALEVVSGNLHLLLAREPSAGLVPIDYEVQLLEGITDLKTIKALQDELEDLIDDDRFQDARPIVDSLVDELRITTIYLPLATYPDAIDAISPLIDAGKLDEAEQALIDVLNTYVVEEEITPLSIIRAEVKLSEALQIEHKKDLSKQQSKNKIEKLLKEAEREIKVAEALGYGNKDDYELLYDSIDDLKKEIGAAGFKGEWAKVKKAVSAFKNKIVHPRS